MHFTMVLAATPAILLRIRLTRSDFRFRNWQKQLAHSTRGRTILASMHSTHTPIVLCIVPTRSSSMHTTTLVVVVVCILCVRE